FRLDWKALAGFGLGILVQCAMVVGILGPEIFGDYAASIPFYAQHAQVERITPDHQHSLAGILTNIVGQENSHGCKGVHLVFVVGAAFLLFKIVRGHGFSSTLARGNGRMELAAVVIFTVFLAPHLLTHDLSLLLIPAAFLAAEGIRDGDFEAMKLG